MNRKLKVLYLNIEHAKEGGVSRWIDVVSRYTANEFETYVFTTNKANIDYGNAIVPYFPHIQDDDLTIFNTKDIKFKKISFPITSEIVRAAQRLKPDVIVVCGNNPIEIAIPAILEHKNSLVVGRYQNVNILMDYEDIFLRDYVEGVLLFSPPRNWDIIKGKPVLIMNRLYDSQYFYKRNVARYDNAIAYFGRVSEGRDYKAFYKMIPILEREGVELHLYVLPCPPNLQNELDKMKKQTRLIRQFDWIRDEKILSDKMNKYKVGIYLFTRAGDLLSTFGQGTIEQIACGMNLFIPLDENDLEKNKQISMEYYNYYGKYINKLFISESTIEYTLNRAIKVLKGQEKPLEINQELLKDFQFSSQKNRYVSFIRSLYEKKFG